MQRWNSKREMMGDDPPYLAVGTEVSAKYKGAFCEAKVRKVVRSVKCKVAFKLGLGTATVTDDQIRGTLRAGVVVEAKHPDKKEYAEATITKIQDCSQYTVVFDDGDITTLRRTALCLKSGRHFAESETLDQLPLTHPEHFGNPVIGGRRGRRNRQDDSSDDEELVRKGKQRREEKEADIGKVVCVEISEKKKQKDNWFPGLVVAPTAQDTVRIHVREEYLVRSFKDGRYYTVPKKEATPFTREIGSKVDNNTLRTAVEKALLFLDRDELPPHWDRELLFGLDETSNSDSDAALDSDSSDDEPREEKDHFVAQLYKFMDDRGTPINKGPTISGKDVDLYKLFKVVHKLGGYNRVTNHNQWKTISHKLGFGQTASTVNLVKHAYKKFLHSFEDFYRKLGCTMVNHPRNNRARHRSNRSLIRDRDRALANKEKSSDKDGCDDSKEASSLDISRKEEIPVKLKEDEKSKESVEPQKSLRDTSRKETTPKNKLKDEKQDKKDINSKDQSVVKKTEPDNLNIKSKEVTKSDEREDRIKMRESVKAADASANLKLEGKQEKELPKSRQKDKDSTQKEKEPEEKDTQKPKVNKKDTKEVKGKQEEKEDKLNKSEREVSCRTAKKLVTPIDTDITSSNNNNNNSQNIASNNNETVLNNVKVKKRSIFSKVTGAKKTKKQASDKPELNKVKKVLGLTTTRQKRSLKDRFKAIVKKIRFKGGNKNCSNNIVGKESKNSKENTNASLPVPNNTVKPNSSDAIVVVPLSKTPSSIPSQSHLNSASTVHGKITLSGKDEKKRVANIQTHKVSVADSTDEKNDNEDENDKNEIVNEKNKVHDDNDEKTDKAHHDSDGHDDKGKEEEGVLKDSSYCLHESSTSRIQREAIEGLSQIESVPVVQSAASVRVKSNDTSSTSPTTDSAIAPKNIQLTRSKSKEDGPGKIKKVEPQVGDCKKPAAVPLSSCASLISSVSSSAVPALSQNPSSGPPETEKKRGRKRKDDEKGGSSEEVLDQLPSYKSVSVGDKLKVYYGPTHESKVTYEAKVLSTKEEGMETLYLVHYTGWNTRYDEWIKRSRIADNLSWSPGRVKRNRLQQQQQHSHQLPPKQSVCANSKRGSRGSDASNASSGSSTTGAGCSTHANSHSASASTAPVRRMTTHLSSRTPPTHATRTYTRTNKQRPRSISGHTDFSESESEEYDNSDSDVEMSTVRSGLKRNDKMMCSGDEKEEGNDITRNKRRISSLLSPSTEEKPKDTITVGAKRKLVPSSTSEDEREGKRSIDKSHDDKVQNERRTVTRSSVEKEVKHLDENILNSNTNSERVRGRKLRSDKMNRILSESEDEKDNTQEQFIKKELRRTMVEKKRSIDNSRAKTIENKKVLSMDEENDGDDDEDEDDQMTTSRKELLINKSTAKLNEIKVEDQDNNSQDNISLKGRSDKRKSDSLLKSTENENEKDSRSEVVKDDDCSTRSDRLRSRVERKKSLFETKMSPASVSGLLGNDDISHEITDVKPQKIDISKTFSEQNSSINQDEEDDEEMKLIIKQEIKNDSDSIEIFLDDSNSDGKRKIKKENRKSGMNSDSKSTVEPIQKDETSQEGERRRSRRLPMRKDEVSKIVIPKDDPEDEQPKGRDFDLIQIRSELKGFEKAVKLSSEIPNKAEVQDLEMKQVDATGSSIKEVTEVKIKQEEESSPTKEIDLLADDIYEFKEPEPFEFEVRQKCSDEKGGKLQRRPFGRICDELSKNTSPIRRKIIKPKPEVSSPPENKKRFRSFTKKKEEPVSIEPKSDNDIKNSTVSDVPVLPLATDNVVTAVTTLSPVPVPSPVVAVKCNLSSDIIMCMSPKPLQLFDDIPEKQVKEHSISVCEKPLITQPMPKLEKRYSDVSEQMESDSEDRLVISEIDDTEIETEKLKETILSQPKEESQPVSKFPVTTVPVVTTTTVPTTTIISTPRSSELFSNSLSSPPSLSNLNEQSSLSKDSLNFIDSVPVVKKIINETTEIKKEENVEIKEAVVEDEEEEEENDALNAAIQRVILQSMTDDESNDVDLISTSSDTATKSSKQPSPIPQVATPSPQLVHNVSSYSPSRKENSRRKKTSKTMLSKEFIEDTDSDSDDNDSIIKIKTTTTFSRSTLLPPPVYPLKDEQQVHQKQSITCLSPPPLIAAPIAAVQLPCFNFKTDENNKLLQKNNVGYQISPSSSFISIPSPSRSPFADLVCNLPSKPAIATTSNSDKVIPDLIDSIAEKINDDEGGDDDDDDNNDIINKDEDVPDKTKVETEEVELIEEEEEEAAEEDEEEESAGGENPEEENTEEKADEAGGDGSKNNEESKDTGEVQNESEDADNKTSEAADSAVTSEAVNSKPEVNQPIKEEVNKTEEKKEIINEEKDGEEEIEETMDEEKKEIKIFDKPDPVDAEEEEEEEEEDKVQQAIDEESKDKENCEDEGEKNDDGSGDSNEELPAEVEGEDGNFGDEDPDDEDDDDDDDKDKEQEKSLSERSDVEEEESPVEESQPEIKKEEEECVQSLLCEETIPGSPAPVTNKDKEQESADNVVTLNPNTTAELPFASAPGSSLHTGAPAYTKPVIAPQPIQPPVQPPPEAAPVMDNTPPTTPESSLSPISNSPRGERSGSSPGLDNESSKSHRDSSEIDLDVFPDHNKMGNYSEEDSVCNINMPGTTILKKQTPINNRLEPDLSTCKKRRRSRKRSEDASKRAKLARRSPRNPAGSDSDDTSENSLTGSSLDLPSSRSPKPSKYNFYIQLDPELDGAQRIAVLQQKLQELRKTYMSLKTELACIDRRRKKLRRREREEKSSKQEVPCS